jgi:hypothetical protein
MAQLEQILAQLRQSVGWCASQIKEQADAIAAERGNHALIRQELQRQQRDIQNIADALSMVKGAGGTGGGDYRTDDIRYIEQIPGRRVPFDMLVRIPIGNNITALQQNSTTVSQDGPFVAVARFAAFQSVYQFSRRDPETQALATFVGRSFGRFRPIHSAWDLNDAAAGVFQPTVGAALPGTGAGIYASPSNHSSFRTMEFDGIVTFLNQGSAYHRSNIEVPSAFWTEQINSPFQLGSFDFFERGETLQWQVTPLHVNNPGAGNLSGYGAGGTFPFIDSQYDVHEGVLDPENVDVTTDPIQRLPDGILFIGFHGFRVIQPPGPVAMT